jgi:hypothetical protein
MNYAEVWNDGLLEILNQETLVSPFITSNVRWIGAKTFHFTQMSVSGYKNHSRAGGWNAGAIAQTDVPYTLTHDRDVEFLIDKADVDETNATASIQNVSMVFEQTQVAPETDALFFSKVATKAESLTGYHSSTPRTSTGAYTKSNVFGKLKGFLSAGKIRRYKARGSLIMYVSSFIMDLLEQSTEFTRKIEMTQIAEGGMGIETRVTDIDGVTVMEVIDEERFYNKFNFNPTDGGFEPCVATYAKTKDVALVNGKTYYTESAGTYSAVASNALDVDDIGDYYEKTDGSYKINVLIACAETCKLVPKMNSIYYFEPGAHTKGDGYLYQNRNLSDVFVFPNGKDGNIDSIYVDLDTVEYTA